MLTLPPSLTVKRNRLMEAKLTDKARAWITRTERSKGIHASEILDPRLAYWKRVDPQPYPDRLVMTFLVGQILHAFIISAVEGGKLSWDTDIGSLHSDELGIEYSMDFYINDIVRELKTSRSFYEPKTIRDIEMYNEQLLVYLAATNTIHGQLWILYVNLKDAEKRTSPELRCYDIDLTQADLDAHKLKIIAIRENLEYVLASDDPAFSYQQLPLCRDWLCSPKMCDYFEKCKPQGRYEAWVAKQNKTTVTTETIA